MTVGKRLSPNQPQSQSQPQQSQSHPEQKEQPSFLVPTIDLSNPNETELLNQVAQACSTLGFFNVIHHDIPMELVANYRSQIQAFFALPYEIKDQLRRNETNARGYFDDELTKQKLDWKECLDVGVPGCRDWNVLEEDDDDDNFKNIHGGEENENENCNTCLEGCNLFPKDHVLPGFRSTVVEYFEACAKLSDRIADLMARGLIFMLLQEEQTDIAEKSLHCGETKETTFSDVTDKIQVDSLVNQMRKDHTSYLRVNHYPPRTNSTDNIEDNDANKNAHTSRLGQRNGESKTPLGVSPHTDAGFLTILMQDEGCHSLQVAYPKHKKSQSNSSHLKTKTKLHPSNQDQDIEWITVQPVENAFTINTGDMAMIWSNGRYRAPLHRVLTHPSQRRYSAPFFYNPGYTSIISPMLFSSSLSLSSSSVKSKARYQPCNWGYFRAVRFAGDLTDLGAEIQISDFEISKHDDDDNDNDNDDYHADNTSKSHTLSSRSHHIWRQEQFLQKVDFQKPFSVEKYRTLLVGDLPPSL